MDLQLELESGLDYVQDTTGEIGVSLETAVKRAAVLCFSIKADQSEGCAERPADRASLVKYLRRAAENGHGRLLGFHGNSGVIIFGSEPPSGLGLERAIDTALQIQQSLRKSVRDSPGTRARPASLGIGIHLGPVMVSTVSFGEEEHPVAVGASVELAAKLADFAEPDEILTTRANLLRSQVPRSAVFCGRNLPSQTGRTHELWTILG